MKKEERLNRIIARGESKNHAHVIVGDAVVRNQSGEILIDIKGKASIRHLLEASWMAGEEKWSEEHLDIDLTEMPHQVRHGDVLLAKVGEKTYKFIGQNEYDPYEKEIQRLKE